MIRSVEDDDPIYELVELIRPISPCKPSIWSLENLGFESFCVLDSKEKANNEWVREMGSLYPNMG